MDNYFYTMDSLLNLPSIDDKPLSYLWLRDTQKRDSQLLESCNDPNSGFYTTTFDKHDIIYYTQNCNDRDTDWKIFLTNEAVDYAAKYFHQLFNP